MSEPTTEAPDLLYGAERIAEFLGVTRPIVYHLIETGKLPAKKWGRTVCASRREIMEAVDGLPDRPLRNGHQGLFQGKDNA
jgi:excisionase family DNA binding protein